MAQTIRFVRDTLTIDQSVISARNAGAGDTLGFAGRQVTLVTLCVG